ncbi:MAG: hypothetical protein KJ674_00420 [Nanoarchaeota archaeon]|nr:hypothetical protein [Nanoarchaeota archaeon]
MKTYLMHNTEKLLKKIDPQSENYNKIKKNSYIFINKKYKSKEVKIIPVKFPQEIKILPETIGLMVGEGYFGIRSFTFANSNEVAIDDVIDFLKQFNLPIKIYLEVSTKNIPKNFEEKSKKFWENHLKTKIKRVRVRREFNNITKYGTIHLTVNNTILAKILNKIIGISKPKIEKSKKLSIDYLKGIIAAEGNINIQKRTKCVYMIRISSNKIEERNHYKKCLKSAGLNIYCKDMPNVSKKEAKEKGWKTTKGRAGAVIISKWENFIKVFQLELLNLNKDKKDKFAKYFVNNKFTKQFISFNYFLGKEFDMKSAGEHFNFVGRNLDRILTLQKQGYISKRKRNNINKYKLTKKYILLYKKLTKNKII